MKKINFLSLLMFFFCLNTFAQNDLFDDIAGAIRVGDVNGISKYFGTKVDLTFINQEELYSKAQATQLLKDFFGKNNPATFTIIHKGVSKEGSKYAIGTLTTTQGTVYRTYFYIKQNGGTSFIQELRFMIE